MRKSLKAMPDGQKNKQMKPSKMSVFTVFWLALATSAVPAQAVDSAEPEQYEINCFVTTRGSSPEIIINLDNNRQLLWACTMGRTVEQLKASGVQFNQSQIELLENWNLLRRSEDTLTTAFSILGPGRATKLRSRMKGLAEKLGPGYQKKVEGIRDELKAQGRERSLYTILFSYILDDLVWDLWAADHILAPRDITVTTPFWNGVVWADYPPRDFSCGTNSISDKGVALKINWSTVAIPKMMPFVAGWKNLGRMFDELVASVHVVDAKAREVFGPYNLFDVDGTFTIPVIDERTDNALHSQCAAFGQNIAREFPKVANPEGLAKDFALADANTALVISYHEFMWELLDYFTQKGVISKPSAFADPENAQPEDIGDLVFVVIR